MKAPIAAIASLALLAFPAGSAENAHISERGVPHFEAPVASGAAIALHIRSGDIRILGSDSEKLTVDISGKNKDKIEDLRYVLTSGSGRIELRVSGGPRNELTIEVHIPRNSDLYARIPAGDVTIEKVVGSKDVELHAGDLTIEVGNPADYARAEASVSAGDIAAGPFGESHSGLFRSFSKSGTGKYNLHAHIGAGDLTLK
jgi:hypothetical protein